MGRKAYPADLLILTGQSHMTKDELQRRKMNEIQIRSKDLECPDYLPDDVKQEWENLVRLYRESGADILCDLDKNAIEVYCNAAVLYKMAMKKIRETSAVIIKRGSTKPKPNPWIRIAKRSAMR